MFVKLIMKLLQFAFLSLSVVVGVTSSALNACVWNNATRSCAWHISKPLAALADSNFVDLGTLNAKGRALILGGYALDVCVQQQSESGCLSASVNGTSVCQWRADARTSPIAFLASQPTRCMPTDSIMAEYLGLTTPSKCPEEATLGICTSDYKCRYEDHIDHAHCLVDMMYMQKVLGGASNPLAVAANKAQHLCAPETVWTTFETNRPQPLSQLECVQKETFEAPEGLTARLAMAAGLVEAAPAPPPSSSPPRPNPTPSPITKDNSNGKAATVAECQLLTPSMCVPTLLSLANVVPMNMKSNPARILMSAVSSAVTCTFNQSLPADAAIQQQCSQTALDSIPNLLTDVYNPSCAKLSETTCMSRPGCTLKPHGDHMDCTQGMFYAFEYLGGGELSLHIQDKADACRGAVASCGESTTTITSDMMTAWNAAVALSPPDALEEEEEHEHEHDYEHDRDHDHDGGRFGEETQALRVASVFIILVAGFVGCALPSVFKGFLATGTLAHRLVQSASAGIIISLALIHIATHAVIEMEGLDKAESGDGHDHQHRRRSLLGTAFKFTRRHLLQHDDHDHAHDHAEADDGDGFTYESHHHPYPIGMAVVVFGFLLMILFEHLASVIHRSQSEHVSLGPACKAHRRGAHIQHQSQPPDVTSSGHLDDSVEKGKALELSESGPDSPTSTTTSQQSRLVMAVLFEVGCVAHSFIIGMSLGVSLTFEDIRPLLVALCFHQLLEGISLGTVLLYSGLHLFKQLSLIFVYAITCPLGVGVGIAIAYSYNPHSVTARAVQGTFNGVAAGMLLYLGMALILADLWLEEYKRPLHRVLSFAVLCIGVGVMAVIAMWA